MTQKDQIVTGETAVFDTKTNLITMLGGVVLTQGGNVLRGDRLLVDMTTGVSRVESDSERCRDYSYHQVRGPRDFPDLVRRQPRQHRLARINPNSINHLCGMLARQWLKPAPRACIYRDASTQRMLRCARDIRSIMLCARLNPPTSGSGIAVKG